MTAAGKKRVLKRKLDEAERKHNRTIFVYMRRKFGHSRWSIAWTVNRGMDHAVLIEVVDEKNKRVSRRTWEALGARGVPIMDWDKAKKDLWPFMAAQRRIEKLCANYVRGRGWTNQEGAPAYLADALTAILRISERDVEPLLAAVWAWRRVRAADRAAFVAAMRQGIDESKARVNLGRAAPAALHMLEWLPVPQRKAAR
jgi:hypothetical protein